MSRTVAMLLIALALMLSVAAVMVAMHDESSQIVQIPKE